MEILHYNGNRNETGPRLDRFILDAFPILGAATLHRWLRQNKLKLNGKKQPLSTRLLPGDEVRLYPPAGESLLAAPDVLYEDAYLLALHKPAGLPSLAPDGQDSLLAAARRHCAGQSPGPGYPALCHRLDTGTSGVILLAKDAGTLALIEQLQQVHRLRKTYLLATVGHPVPEAGILSGYLFKDAKRGIVYIRQKGGAGAKPVETRYETLAAAGRFSLVQATLVTGRTHQIRAQFAAAGTPLLGDSKYGDAALNRMMRTRYQCLCALKVSFPRLASPAFPGCSQQAVEALSGLTIHCPAPWFDEQLRNGTLA